MKFKDLMEKYKNKTATPEEKVQVEEEIEKFEEIESYLDADLKSSLHGMKVEEGKSKTATEVNDFTNTVQKAVRRSLRKTGLITGSILLVIVLFLVFGLSPLLDAIYYNPTKVVLATENGDTLLTQLQLDMLIYSELNMPAVSVSASNRQKLGNGNYEISLEKDYGSQLQAHERRTGGAIRRGTLELYEPSFLDEGIYPVFYEEGNNRLNWFLADDYLRSTDRITLTTLQDALLVETGFYRGNVVFEEDEFGNLTIPASVNDEFMGDANFEIWFENPMTFDEYLAFLDSTLGVPQSLYIDIGDGHTMGVEANIAREPLTRKEKNGAQISDSKYPLLLDAHYNANSFIRDESGETRAVFDPENKEVIYNPHTEGNMKTHFLSAVRYMADNSRFLDMLGEDVGKYEAAGDYVEENGLTIKGMVMNVYSFSALYNMMYFSEGEVAEIRLVTP